MDYLDQTEHHQDVPNLHEPVDVEIVTGKNKLSKRYVRDSQNPYEWWRAHEFTRRYRFTKEVVMYYILPLINHKLVRPNNRGSPVLPELQLPMNLLYYASGHFQRPIGDLHGSPQATVCRVIHRVSVALAELLHEFVHFPSTRREKLFKIQQFFNKAGVPGIGGVIEGVHIEIISPGKTIGEIFRNRKGYFSINVLVVVGLRGEILHIDVRYPGGYHDSTCVDRSGLQVIFIQQRVEGILLGDEGYPNLPWLIAPFVTPRIEVEASFNECHIMTRNVVETTFGRWKNEFYCLKGIILYHIGNAISIICACAVLWNIHIDLNFPNDEDLENFGVEDAALTIPAMPGTNGLQYKMDYVQRHFAR